MWEQLEQWVSRFWHDFGLHDWTVWGKPVKREALCFDLQGRHTKIVFVQYRKCLVCNKVQERRVAE